MLPTVSLNGPLASVGVPRQIVCDEMMLAQCGRERHRQDGEYSDLSGRFRCGGWFRQALRAGKKGPVYFRADSKALFDMGWLGRLDRAIAGIIDCAQWLALPLIVLLFLQWPLRDFFRSYSREANDLAQIFFALFVAVSVVAATRSATHLAADALARRYSLRVRHTITKIGVLAGLVPWALFILASSYGLVGSSLRLRETFPDTANPGYFVIKLALWVMAVTVLMQALLDIARPLPRDDA